MLSLARCLESTCFEWPSLIVDEDGHFVEGGFMPGPQEGYKIEQVNPYNLLLGLIPHLPTGMKALSPAAKGFLGDSNILYGLRLRKLLLAKPDAVATTTAARIRRHTTCLLELPGY